MIQPDDIRRTAENLYPKFLRASLTGEQFFPKEIRGNKSLDKNLANAAASVQRLRAESKEIRGFGYSVEWEERNSRTHGRNFFPRRIFFETREDYLLFIGKRPEFERFKSAADRLRTGYPELDNWILSHLRALIDAEPVLDGLLEVVEYLRNNPRPGLFARELPLSVNTKFIEKNRRVLRQWLDLLLPARAIRSDEETFERRYGLRYADQLFPLRFLDRKVQERSGSPWSSCSIDTDSLAEHPIVCEHVLLVENKVSLLTLPPLRETIAIGGLGDAIIKSRPVDWLRHRNVWYWGDIDVAGLTILSRLRAILPDVRSTLMDEATVSRWRDRIGGHRASATAEPPSLLTPGEAAAFRNCTSDNFWIEQERFPPEFVREHFARLFASDDDHLASCARVACVLEAKARKPGNVHPEASFANLEFRDFVRSAQAVAPVIARTMSLGVGPTVLAAIAATRSCVSQNTNLGIVLLIAPLAAVSAGETLKDGLPRVLNGMTRDDADAVYRAIRLAQPGGMGNVDDQDVATVPTVTLAKAMKMAADRDSIAAQYASDFLDVLDFGLPILAKAVDFARCWEETIIDLHLRLMARLPDTLIARKCGREIAKESAIRAQQVLDAGGPTTENGRMAIEQFDAWLRGDGNRRNPGTTADLVAACLFAAFRERVLDVSAMRHLVQSDVDTR